MLRIHEFKHFNPWSCLLKHPGEIYMRRPFTKSTGMNSVWITAIKKLYILCEVTRQQKEIEDKNVVVISILNKVANVFVWKYSMGDGAI